MKKEIAFKFSILTSLILSFGKFVSAQESQGGQAVRTVAEAIQGAYDLLQLDVTVLSTLLLGILLWMVLYSIITQIFSFKGRWNWLWTGIVSLIIVVLTFIYLPENFVEAIVLQYGAMGAALLSIIPLAILIYFTTVVNKSLLISRVTWAFYCIYYFGLFTFKLVSSPATDSLSSFFTANIPYVGAILVGIFMFIYIGFWRAKAFKAKIESDVEAAGRDIQVRAAGREIERREAESRGIGVSGHKP